MRITSLLAAASSFAVAWALIGLPPADYPELTGVTIAAARMPMPSGSLEIAADAMPSMPAIYVAGGIEIVSQSGATSGSQKAAPPPAPAPAPGAGGNGKTVTFTRSGGATVAVAEVPTPTASSVTVTFTSSSSAATIAVNGAHRGSGVGRLVTFTSTPAAPTSQLPKRPTSVSNPTRKTTGMSTKSGKTTTHKQTAAEKKAIAARLAEKAAREKIAKEKAIKTAVRKAGSKVPARSLE
ncbi:hypothetical protein HDU89_004540 [Geranomyces variabilis]|nr:hypothetical protein HDU89_004540 [Geranomyces variabilis]